MTSVKNYKNSCQNFDWKAKLSAHEYRGHNFMVLTRRGNVGHLLLTMQHRMCNTTKNKWRSWHLIPYSSFVHSMTCEHLAENVFNNLVAHNDQCVKTYYWFIKHSWIYVNKRKIFNQSDQVTSEVDFYLVLYTPVQEDSSGLSDSWQTQWVPHRRSIQQDHRR